MTDKPKPKRRWMQFSLRTLLVFVAFVAVGCAALLNASSAWQTLIFTATFAILFIATVGGLLCRGRGQAFWIGFAVVGWLYLLVVYGFFERENNGPKLATTRALVFAWNAVRHDDPLSFSVGPSTATSTVVGPYSISPAPPQSMTVTFQRGPFPPREFFMNIGQYLWALLLAFLGGLLGRYFYWARNRESWQSGPVE